MWGVGSGCQGGKEEGFRELAQNPNMFGYFAQNSSYNWLPGNDA